MGISKLAVSTIWILTMTSGSSLAQAPWFGVFVKTQITNNCAAGSVECGANCYVNSTAIAAAKAFTASGKCLTLSSGVWVQADGNNVLRVDGSDNWHYALNANGRSFSSTLLNKTTANLGGRTCPSSVYVDDSDKVASGRCLYYDSGNAPQTLVAAGSNQTDQATMGLANWMNSGTSAAEWYEGNIKTCADKGMRLPTLYETNRSDPGGTNQPTDGYPIFNSANGVPPATQSSATWTASASKMSLTTFWRWTTSSALQSTYGTGGAIRCVLP